MFNYRSHFGSSWYRVVCSITILHFACLLCVPPHNAVLRCNRLQFGDHCDVVVASLPDVDASLVDVVSNLADGVAGSLAESVAVLLQHAAKNQQQ